MTVLLLSLFGLISVPLFHMGMSLIPILSDFVQEFIKGFNYIPDVLQLIFNNLYILTHSPVGRCVLLYLLEKE